MNSSCVGWLSKKIRPYLTVYLYLDEDILKVDFARMEWEIVVISYHCL